MSSFVIFLHINYQEDFFCKNTVTKRSAYIMKILLCAVNAKYIHTNIALRCIKEYCKSKISSELILKEYTINNYVQDIVNDIYKVHPDIVSFSVYIWNKEITAKASVLLKLLLPDVKIVFGGPEVSYNPSDVMAKIPECDIIISGEGEITSEYLYRAIETGESIEAIKGITYRTEDDIITNPPREPMDMGDIPFPYTDFSEISNKICYYEASRGCPFNCQYCLSSIEKGVRFAPIEKVKRDLKIFIENKVKQVKFVDRTFNANKNFAKEIILFIIANDNNITNFHFEVAAELMNEELIQLLGSSRKGLFQLEIGVQSTNDDTLREISRNGDFSKITEIVNKIQSYQNIHIHLDLIAGLPYEDLNSFKKSFNDVHSLFPNQLQLGFLKVLHGSGMEKLVKEHDIKYSPYIPYEVLSTKYLGFDDILFLKDIEEMTETYYNSRRFNNSLRYLYKHSESYFTTYEKLAETKSTEFIDNITHNKNDTYTFLLKALNKFENTDINIFKWLLKFDYIIHEKPKGNPDWIHLCQNMLDKNGIYDIIVRNNSLTKYFPELIKYDPKEILNFSHAEKFPLNPISLEKKDTIILINYHNRDTDGNAEYIIMDQL